MRRVLAMLATAMMWAALLAPTAALAKQPQDKGKPDKVPVCHYDSETGTYKQLELGGKALEAHLGHGDLLPGNPHDAAPDMPGFHYDEGICEPQQHIHAVAYSDSNPDDGGFNPHVDVLISKLVEGPNGAHDGRPGPGDIIITSQYPVDTSYPLDPSSPPDPSYVPDLGAYKTTEHVVQFVSTGSGIFAVADGAVFVWKSEVSWEFYSENCAAGCGGSSFEDRWTSSGTDLLEVILPSPSKGTTTVVRVATNSPQDDTFIDVDIYYLPWPALPVGITSFGSARTRGTRCRIINGRSTRCLSRNDVLTLVRIASDRRLSTHRMCFRFAVVSVVDEAFG